MSSGVSEVAVESAAAHLARAALRYLAERRLPPTPDQYRLAWRAVGGSVSLRDAEEPPAPAAAGQDGVGTLLADVLHQIDLPHRNWTVARKKEALGRLLTGSRSQPARLAERLKRLVDSWRQDEPDAAVAAPGDALPACGGEIPGTPVATTTAGAVALAADAATAATAATATAATADAGTATRIAAIGVAAAGLPVRAAGSSPVATDGVGADSDVAPERADQRLGGAQGWVNRRRIERVLGDMTELLVAVCETVPIMVEEEAWVRRQFDAIRSVLDTDGKLPDSRDLAQARLLLRRTAEEHQRLLKLRRDSVQMLKTMIAQCVEWLRSLTESSDRFGSKLGVYMDQIQSSSDLPTLAGTVRALLEDTRDLYGELDLSKQGFVQASERARHLEEEVSRLAQELRKTSEQVMTDHLTSLLNRRGLERAFEDLAQRCHGEGRPLSLAILDVDDFKKLNDALGHQAGDDALRHLAGLLRGKLRPADLSARYGGEEFVILLPDVAGNHAADVVRRLQRALTAEVFLHRADQVFITFSAGVTDVRPGESLIDTVSRADDAMYEAKRSGKNRVCVADATATATA